MNIIEWSDIDIIANNLSNFVALYYDLSQDCVVSLIGISENANFYIEDRHTDLAFIARVHRHNYQNEDSIISELSWLESLNKTANVNVPKPYKNIYGDYISYVQTIHNFKRKLVLIEYIDGNNFRNSDINITNYNKLGSIIATLHLHSQTWNRPNNFHRFKWDLNSILGNNARFGNWKHNNDLTAEYTNILSQAETKLRSRISTYESHKNKTGLIHSDVHMLNLINKQQEIWVIDFDDCGFSWYMFDIGACLQYVEDSKWIDQLKNNWILGYEKIKHIPAEDIEILDDFILLRRFLSMGWQSTHPEVTIPTTINNIVESAASAAERYLLK